MSSFRVASACFWPPLGVRVPDRLRVARAHPAQAALDVFDESAGAELDDVVALRLARLVDEVDDHDVAVLRRAVLDRDELGDRRAKGLELALDQLLRNIRLRSGHLEPGPLGDLRRRLNRELGGEIERLVLGARHVVVELGLRNGPDARIVGGVPEPAADVGLDGLGEDAVAAEPRLEHLLRDLALAEAGDLGAGREVGGRVLDGVLQVVDGDLDLKADAIVRELFDLSPHAGHCASPRFPDRGWLPPGRARLRGSALLPHQPGRLAERPTAVRRGRTS